MTDGILSFRKDHHTFDLCDDVVYKMLSKPLFPAKYKLLKQIHAIFRLGKNLEKSKMYKLLKIVKI